MGLITYVFVSSKPWHDSLFDSLYTRGGERWIRISDAKSLSSENLKTLHPNKIFIPHWSRLIPENIFNTYECIVFHMTDLPYGRGGSPLQNLIVQGHEYTMMSALRVESGLDTGPIYLKKQLELKGTAQAIFERTVPIVEAMITEIIEDDISPVKQEGEATVFKRRKPKSGDLSVLSEKKEIYDYIRMLDCEGYPEAFLKSDTFDFLFTKARMEGEDIIAQVKIKKRK